MQWIAEGNKARLDTDGLSKVAKSLQYFDGKVPLSVVISVLKEVDNFVAEINPQEVVKITEYPVRGSTVRVRRRSSTTT